MYDISILVPAIRTPRWESLYNSIGLACKKYTWQLVLVSPFDLPQSLQNKTNIKLIKDNGCVARCVQMGVAEVDSNLFFLTVDDGTLNEDSLDIALDEFHKNCGYKDVMCMLYGEAGNLMPAEYHTVWWHESTRRAGIPLTYKTAVQPLMHKQYFIDMGGFDCINFEYQVCALNDLMFRIQFEGGNIYYSPVHSMICTWYPAETGDHKPIHLVEHNHDHPKFDEIYNDPLALFKRKNIKFDNWKNTPDVWHRRFTKGVPDTYESLCEKENYIFDPIKPLGIGS